MSVASIPVFLGAAGHVESRLHVVERHPPLETESEKAEKAERNRQNTRLGTPATTKFQWRRENAMSRRTKRNAAPLGHHLKIVLERNLRKGVFSRCLLSVIHLRIASRILIVSRRRG